MMSFPHQRSDHNTEQVGVGHLPLGQQSPSSIKLPISTVHDLPSSAAKVSPFHAGASNSKSESIYTGETLPSADVLFGESSAMDFFQPAPTVSPVVLAQTIQHIGTLGMEFTPSNIQLATSSQRGDRNQALSSVSMDLNPPVSSVSTSEIEGASTAEAISSSQPEMLLLSDDSSEPDSSLPNDSTNDKQENTFSIGSISLPGDIGDMYASQLFSEVRSLDSSAFFAGLGRTTQEFGKYDQRSVLTADIQRQEHNKADFSAPIASAWKEPLIKHEIELFSGPDHMVATVQPGTPHVVAQEQKAERNTTAVSSISQSKTGERLSMLSATSSYPPRNSVDSLQHSLVEVATRGSPGLNETRNEPVNGAAEYEGSSYQTPSSRQYPTTLPWNASPTLLEETISTPVGHALAQGDSEGFTGPHNGDVQRHPSNYSVLELGTGLTHSPYFTQTRHSPSVQERHEQNPMSSPTSHSTEAIMGKLETELSAFDLVSLSEDVATSSLATQLSTSPPQKERGFASLLDPSTLSAVEDLLNMPKSAAFERGMSRLFKGVKSSATSIFASPLSQTPSRAPPPLQYGEIHDSEGENAALGTTLGRVDDAIVMESSTAVELQGQPPSVQQIISATVPVSVVKVEQPQLVKTDWQDILEAAPCSPTDFYQPQMHDPQVRYDLEDKAEKLSVLNVEPHECNPVQVDTEDADNAVYHGAPPRRTNEARGSTGSGVDSNSTVVYSDIGEGPEHNTQLSSQISRSIDLSISSSPLVDYSRRESSRDNESYPWKHEVVSGYRASNAEAEGHRTTLDRKARLLEKGRELLEKRQQLAARHSPRATVQVEHTSLVSPVMKADISDADSAVCKKLTDVTQLPLAQKHVHNVAEESGPQYPSTMQYQLQEENHASLEHMQSKASSMTVSAPISASVVPAVVIAAVADAVKDSMLSNEQDTRGVPFETLWRLPPAEVEHHELTIQDQDFDLASGNRDVEAALEHGHPNRPGYGAVASESGSLYGVYAENERLREELLHTQQQLANYTTGRTNMIQSSSSDASLTEQLPREIDGLRRQLKGQRQEIKELQDTIKRSDMEKRDLALKVKNLEQLLADAEKHRIELQSNQAMTDEAYRAIQEKLITSSEQEKAEYLDEAALRVLELEHRYDILQEEVLALRAEQSRRDIDVEHLVTNTVSDDSATLSGSSPELRMQQGQLEKTLMAANVSEEELKTYLSLLNEHATSIQEGPSSEQSKVHESIAKDLEFALHREKELQQELRALQDATQPLEANHGACNQNAIQVAYDELSERASMWQEDCILAQEDNVHTKQQLQQANADLLAARTEVELLQAAALEIQHQQQKQQDEYRSLEANATLRLDDTIKQQEMTLMEAAQRVSALESAVSAMATEKENLNESIQHYKGLAVVLEDEVDRLRRTIQGLEHMARKKDVSEVDSVDLARLEREVTTLQEERQHAQEQLVLVLDLFEKSLRLPDNHDEIATLENSAVTLLSTIRPLGLSVQVLSEATTRFIALQMLQENTKARVCDLEVELSSVRQQHRDLEGVAQSDHGHDYCDTKTEDLQEQLLKAKEGISKLQQFLYEFQTEKKAAIFELELQLQDSEKELLQVRSQLAKAQAMLLSRSPDPGPSTPLAWIQQQPREGSTDASHALIAEEIFQGTEQVHHDAVLALEPLRLQKTELERTLLDLRHRYELSQGVNDALLSKLEKENQQLRADLERTSAGMSSEHLERIQDLERQQAELTHQLRTAQREREFTRQDMKSLKAKLRAQH
ncbi:hypothetical protein BGZ99_006898 [Dissophora globulifera]|uniref:Uncharacterized protein n=1 Tax=Dissophora globulifera TaxID=979702 RepID=A0A9P6RF53_9FUNG|nr:hypothetical protein BGZ99_006898 [Dissophora globulifera]